MLNPSMAAERMRRERGGRPYRSAAAWVRQRPTLTALFGALLVFAGLTGLTGLAQKMRFGPKAAYAAGATSGALGGLVGNQDAFETILAEQGMLPLLEILSQRVPFIARDDPVECGEQYCVFSRLMRTVHAREEEH